jgi:hypothetical protein
MTLMISGGGGGGGGATSLGGLSDVTLGVLANGQILQYNSGSGQWENTALTGQLTYQGAFDASTGTPALTNALKGDFYVISVAGTQFGQSWSIGDHLIVNADMGGVIDPAKIDKIDNTETGLQAVVDDTTPQLGGALDVNGNAIVSAAAGDIAITPDTTGNIVLDGLNWPQADGANGQVLQTNGAGQLSFTNQAAGLAAVVDDTTPQLGGALDVNGNAIVSAAAGNIAITPDTTGSIVLDGLNWPQADGSANQVLVTNGAGQLSFTDQTGLTDVVDDTTPQLGGALDVNGNAIVSAAAGDIAITPDTTGSIVLDGLNWPQADGANGQVLVTDGAGQLSFTNQAAGLADVVDDTTPQLGGALDVNGNAIVSAAAGNIAITPDTTGSIVLDGLNWPQADGSANQVLVTNGAGQLSFTDQTGLTDVVDDTTPQLGGALDVNGNAIVSAAAGNIAITPDTTGSIVLDGLNWPQADGANGQVLQTNGAGQLSFTDQTGLTDVVDDTTPQLGGDLDVQARIITTSTANGSIGLEPDGTGSVVARGTGVGLTPGTVTLNCEQNSHGVALQSPPHSAAASYTLKLPTSVGTAGQLLTTDGANPAQLSWSTASGGGSRPGVYTQSASFTIGDGTGTDPGAVTAAELERVYLINNGGSAVTVTLPAIGGNVGAGLKFNIKMLGTANVTIDRNGANIDDSAANQTLSVQYSSYTLCCAGASGWYII